MERHIRVGSSYAELVSLKHDEKLLSANAVAGFCMLNEEGEYLLKTKSMIFLKKVKLKPL